MRLFSGQMEFPAPQSIEGPGAGLAPGQWYAVHNLAGVMVSAIAPENISEDILNARQSNVNLLSSVESNALVYRTAFDLQQFELHFTLGTDHPRLDWSDRPPPSSQDPRLPGPDGVASSAPLVTNGSISPAHTRQYSRYFRRRLQTRSWSV